MRPFSGSITLLHGHGQGDPIFVQHQTSHEQTSATPLYTNVRELHQMGAELRVA
jgi:hypothetical protein